MQLWACSYERFVFCIDAHAGQCDNGASQGGQAPGSAGASGNETSLAALSQAVSVPAHRSAVKCIVSGGTYVASGGADDQIHIFDAARQRDLGYLINPVEGSVPCLAFVQPDGATQPSHLLSGVRSHGLHNIARNALASLLCAATADTWFTRCALAA